eukprot:jgi/Chrzof1/9907/Cz04g20120.t1
MANLDSILDDALLAFEDEDQDVGSMSVGSSVQQLQQPEGALQQPTRHDAAGTVTQLSAGPSNASYIESVSAYAASQASSSHASSSTLPGQSKPGKLAFDPLAKRKGKAAAVTAPAAAPQDPFASAGSQSSDKPALPHEVAQLSDDLAKLVAEWSQALQPGPSEVQRQPETQPLATSNSAVLRALAEQTQKTVAEQAKLRPAGVAGSATAGAAVVGDGAGADGQHMNMIVDVVMQHLLSKDVLYTPMKEIRDKYPPWLEQHKSDRSEAEMKCYEAQYASICRLCDAYETDPDNYSKLMTLLQEMQACGEPPPEIVEDMSSAIAADLPGLGVGGEGGAGAVPPGGFSGLGEDLDIPPELLADLPKDLKNCPMQ